jgi:hypothetical protein
VTRATVIEGVVVVAAGSLLHFTYEWSGENALVGLVTPVNESVWEHTKLVVVPLVVVGVVGFVRTRRVGELWGTLAGAVVGALLLPLVFYGYTGAFGVGNILWVDLLSFVGVVVTALAVKNRLARVDADRLPSPWLAVAGLVLILVLVALATLAPPDLPLFTAP